METATEVKGETGKVSETDRPTYHSLLPRFQRRELLERDLAPAGGGEPAPVGDV